MWFHHLEFVSNRNRSALVRDLLSYNSQFAGQLYEDKSLALHARDLILFPTDLQTVNYYSKITATADLILNSFLQFDLGPKKGMQHIPDNIMITSLCNVYPLTPHFYIVNLGFTGVYIFFLFLLLNIDRGYSLEPPQLGGSNVYPQPMF